MVDGSPLMKSSEGVCNGCLVGKNLERRYEVEKARRFPSTLDLVHSDVSEPMPTSSMNGSKYFLTFIDYYSTYYWIYFLKKKSEVFETFTIFKALAENTLGKNIKALRSYNGGEYIKREFQHLCASAGIQMQHSVPYTPHQDGVAKRKNKSLKEMATCLLE